VNLSALCKIYDFAIAWPGFQCDQVFNSSARQRPNFRPRHPELYDNQIFFSQLAPTRTLLVERRASPPGRL
jgi:hypothetical protein